ncbi:MAG: hypothetical protein ACRD88_08635, partial [Terriglobia bacterium]
MVRLPGVHFCSGRFNAQHHGTIFTKAQEWEVLPDTFANPTRRVKLGRRWVVRPEQILSEE